MKVLISLFVLMSASAMAMPIVCESTEKTNNISTLRLKINEKQNVRMNNSIWELYVLGITPQGKGEIRQVMYASGAPSPDRMAMTILKSDSVYGYIDAYSADANGIYKGIIKISGVLRNRQMNVVCRDEAHQ